MKGQTEAAATTMSARGYAKSRRARGLPGGTLRAIQEAIASGRIPVGPDGTIDPAAADEAWARNTDGARRPHTWNGHGGNGNAARSLVEAKVSESRERARALRMDNDRRAGGLVAVAAVERMLGRIISDAKNRLLGVPSRLKGRRPELSAEDLLAVDAEIRAALDELADRAEGGHHGLTAPRDRDRGADALGPARPNGAGPSRGGATSAPPSHPSSDGARGGAHPAGAGARRCDAGPDGGGSRAASGGAGDVGRAQPEGAAVIVRNRPA